MATFRAYAAIALVGALGGLLLCFVGRSLGGPRGSEQVLTLSRTGSQSSNGGLYHPLAPWWCALGMAVIAVALTAANSNRARVD